MGVDELVLNEVVRRVLAVAKPARIILFGSAATAQMTKDSDIDLLVVEPTAENRHAESVAIRSSMRPPEEEIRLLVGEWLKKVDLDSRPSSASALKASFGTLSGSMRSRPLRST